MVAKSGTVTRPAGSDSFWPSVGTRVVWRLHRIQLQLVEQAERYGIPCKGSLGDTGHLQKHGDHTPWSVVGGVTKPRGIVHGTDWPAEFGDFVLAICRTDEDTSYIDFMNNRGGQYDHGGNRVGSSSDTHFHLSVNAGGESRVVHLMTRYATRNQGDDVELSDSMAGYVGFETNVGKVLASAYGYASAAARDAKAALVKAAGNEAKLNAVLAEFGAEVQRDADEAARDAEELAEIRAGHAELVAAIGAVDPGDAEALAALLNRVRIVLTPADAPPPAE